MSDFECWAVLWGTSRQRVVTTAYRGLVEALRNIAGAEVKDVESKESLAALVSSQMHRHPSRVVVVVLHRNDMESAGMELRRLAEVKNAHVAEIQFTTGDWVNSESVPGVANRGPVPFFSIQDAITFFSGATATDLSSQKAVNELFESTQRRAERVALDPLLALAVLVDGYLVSHPKPGTEWFDPGIEAARAKSMRGGCSVDSDEYWMRLRRSKAAVERIRRVLAEARGPKFGFRVALETVEKKWVILTENADAGSALYERACAAVNRLWITLKAGDPPTNEVLENASLGFQVLVAGHL